jgi:flavin-dependent dehydrogenase
LEAAKYDLIVAGAGPAGCACAISAARSGAQVLLLEKDHFPRHKVCGEFVSPESLELLDCLLSEKRFSDKPQIRTARAFSGKKVISLPVSPAARSIPRFELDAALVEAARAAGVEAQEGATVREVQQDTNFKVTTPEKTFSGRAVVNATGRWSQLTQYAAPKNSPGNKNKDKWIGLKGHFREADPVPSVDLYFFDGGYCGVQPVSGNAVNACAMVRSDVARSLEEVFSRQSDLWQRSRKWKPLFQEISTSPLYFRPPYTVSKGMILAGDAVAFIDPFAGDGISLALHSGSLAAESLVPFLQGRCSLQQAQYRYEAEYKRQFAPALRSAARVRMLLSAPPMIRSSLLRLAGMGPFARAIVRSTRIRLNRR